jgi:hypothetical protein
MGGDIDSRWSTVQFCASAIHAACKLPIQGSAFCCRRYFGGARAVWVQGRQHPVAVMCTTHPEDNYLDAALNAVLQVGRSSCARGLVGTFLSACVCLACSEGRVSVRVCKCAPVCFCTDVVSGGLVLMAAACLANAEAL